MLIEESRRRQEKLKQYLHEMASKSMEESELKQKVTDLKTLYSDGFRHNYSMFFPLIVDIAAKDTEYSLDYLSTNLERIRALIEQDYVEGEKEYTGLYRPLLKLSDHINLEIARYNYYQSNEQQTSDLKKNVTELQALFSAATQELESTKAKLDTAKENLDSAQQKVEKVQTELIAVLSIFAAVVLTFSGSLSFIGQALSGMSEAPFFKSVFFVLLCGIVVFNMIFVMIYTVSKITGKNIYTRCQHQNCNVTSQNCSGIRRVFRRMPYVFWTNLLLLILLALDFILWIINSHFQLISF